MTIRQREQNVRRQSRHRSKRARSFPSEDAAHAYAKANGIAKYTLRNLKYASAKEKKIVIEVQ